MGKKDKRKLKNKQAEVKSFQELSEEISMNQNLNERQPTPQPKDFDEIDY